METARIIIIEKENRTITATLRHAMAIGEIYQHFVSRNRRPRIVTCSDNVARVTF